MLKISLALTVGLVLSINCSIAQLIINTNQSVENFVKNVLIGPGVTVSNVTFNGSSANTWSNQVGQFLTNGTSIGVSDGIILGTGSVSLAAGSNNAPNASAGSTGQAGTDPDLKAICGNTIYDQCVIEFDFVPIGDTISFNYVFASEEYDEFTCTNFNDGFGFFLSGPKPTGGTYNSQNVALIPDPSMNGSYTNTAVAINTVNAGVVGTHGSNTNCDHIDSNWTSYKVFYQKNTVGDYQYDGRTVPLNVIAKVVCGETYHIKLAICDGTDGSYDSGVFLEAGSFTSKPDVYANITNPGDITLCSSDYTVQFNSGANPPPNTYWDFGDGIGTSDSANPSYSYQDSGSYLVTYVAIDSSSCNITDTAQFTVTLTIPEQYSASMDAPEPDPCVDSMLVELDFTGSGADSLIWIMGNGDVFYNIDSLNYYYTNQGTYEITLIAVDNDCDLRDTLVDTVHFKSHYTYTTATPPDDVLLCAPPPYTMHFSSGGSTPPNSYWDFGDGIGTDTATNPSYTYQDTGVYQVMYVVIDSLSCNITDTAYFTVSLAQAEQFNAQMDIPTPDPCQDSMMVDLKFIGSGADSLVWNMGNGDIFCNIDSLTYYYYQQGTYPITLIAYDLDCDYIDTISDTVNFHTTFTYSQALTHNDILICSPPPITASFSAGPNPPVNNWWDFGDGMGSDTAAHPTYTYQDTGKYKVMYIAIDSNTCNIADTVYFDVKLEQAEQFSATMNIPEPDPCTDSMLVELVFTGSGADSLIWNLGNGDIFYNIDSLNYHYLNQGNYTITLIAIDNKCDHIDTLTELVTFNTTYTLAEATPPGDVILCEPPYDLDFSIGQNVPPASYWNFGDGIGTSNEHNPSYTYSQSGVYNGIYVAIDSTTCNIADTAHFTVNLHIAEEFSATLDFTPPKPCQEQTLPVHLQFTGTGADSLIWDMGNGDIFNGLEIDYEYVYSGTYTIELTAYDLHCDKEETIISEVKFHKTEDPQFRAPNVFSPNGDGINDRLVFANVDVTQDFEVVIFNRWGMEVYRSDSPLRGWDGRMVTGEKATSGVYFYEVRCTNVCDLEPVNLPGSVHLMR